MSSLQHPYTPTDEEVAGRYVDARYQYSDTRKAETRAEFDRFLARVRREAKAEAWSECVTALKRKATEYTEPAPGPEAPEAEWADWRGWYYTWCAAVQHATDNPYRQEQS